jgi:GxxExxY protein
MEKDLVFKNEYYQIIGICMEVHRILGGGLSEVLYKDALEYEFRMAKIPYQREKEYTITYKGLVLPHKFYADFVVFDNIILEVKALSTITDAHIAQTANYVRLANSLLGILANFTTNTLLHKRVIG